LFTITAPQVILFDEIEQITHHRLDCQIIGKAQARYLLGSRMVCRQLESTEGKPMNAETHATILKGIVIVALIR
jgi:hypothetical protein